MIGIAEILKSQGEIELDWSLAADDFNDGCFIAFRDICILDTSSADWDRFLAVVRAGSLPFRFKVDGEEVAMPETFQEIHQMRAEASPLLVIDPEDMFITCHFWDDEEIELDIWPKNFVDFADGDFVYADYIAKVGALSAFIAQVGRMLNKTVIVTPDNQHESVIWHYEPSADRWIHWSELRSTFYPRIRSENGTFFSA